MALFPSVSPSMRPAILYPLFAAPTALSGIGPRLAPLLEKAVGPLVVDLLWHLPTGLQDRGRQRFLSEAVPGQIGTFLVQVDRHQPSAHRGRPYLVLCSDQSGALRLTFFHARGDWLQTQLPEGSQRLISGMVEQFRGEVQIAHPDYILPPDRADEIPRFEVSYPLTNGLPAKTLAKASAQARKLAPDLPEWLDPTLLKREQWPGWQAALIAAHSPETLQQLSPESPARQRLAYDELLANQLALALVRLSLKERPGRIIPLDSALRQSLLAALPFPLTGAQMRALAEIDSDLALPSPMLRLLQGDVGSGKTVVAALAMASAVAQGSQAALMAPTEILARQHFNSLKSLLPGLRIAQLTGRDIGKSRQNLLEEIKGGQIDILVGTHALFQETVVFHDLALAVIDEQHRFGVHQRLDLSAKGQAVDLLVMTATPIPRTLMLTAYGDMEVSRLDEKPPGRQAVITRVMPLSKLDAVLEAVARAVAAGAKVFWVCPLIEESESLDLANAEARHLQLSKVLGSRVGLVHGRLKAAAKDAAMAGFSGQSFDILVATTVIEVGVDIPAASVMVIEHAERFGLAQLHQLRGRIGRGSSPASCLLLYGAPLSATARNRLHVLRDSDDGFLIAEADLRLRGAGELLGSRQSGLPNFRLADLEHHNRLLAIARDDAQLVLARDRQLLSPRGQALRTLLYLFQRDAVVQTLRSG